MPKDKRSGVDKTLDDDVSTPATPRTKRSGANSPSLSGIAHRKTQDETPVLKRSTSATSSSAAKVVSRAGSMAPPPPRTPSRTSSKARMCEEPVAKVASPKPIDKSQVDEVDTLLEEEIQEVLAMPASPPVVLPSDPVIVQPVVDAGAPIDDFDWSDLEQRYQANMQDLEQQEFAVYEELARLNHMFQAWAEAGQTKESDRASKRLRTRVAYVQHEELQLREKREHYLHVVNAFKSALNLLERN